MNVFAYYTRNGKVPGCNLPGDIIDLINKYEAHRDVVLRCSLCGAALLTDNTRLLARRGETLTWVISDRGLTVNGVHTLHVAPCVPKLSCVVLGKSPVRVPFTPYGLRVGGTVYLNAIPGMKMERHYKVVGDMAVCFK